jgi:hypothetical protein
MKNARIRHVAAAALAALSLSVGATSVAHATDNVGSFGQEAKGCKLPGNGKTVGSGSTGTDSDGKTYSCKDGVGCQVENGKTTDKCSHMEAMTTGGSKGHGKHRPRPVRTAGNKA